MMNNSVPAVTCLKSFAHCAVLVKVKINTEVFYFKNIRRTFGNKLFNSGKSIFILSRNQCIRNMQLVAVVNRIKHTRNTALRKRTV